MKFSQTLLSHAGGRSVNQDCCDWAAQEQTRCWVVADGLGGHRGGEIASRLAVDKILASFRAAPEFAPAAVRAHLEKAQQTILERQEKEPALASMRTTVVVLLTAGSQALWGHIGDSRLYHFGREGLDFQTSDHSVPQALANAGRITPAEIRYHEDRNRLLRTLGHAGKFEPEVLEEAHPLQADDALLLCTDGFWEYVTELEMEVDLARAVDPDTWIGHMERRLRKRVDGEHDNYSAVGVFVKAPQEKDEKS